LMDQHESLGTGFNEMIDVPKMIYFESVTSPT
jgi:hypothetical protein